ncbi:hypothetical protein [Sporosarcina sp. JAI121]|nr:hypothetical protein [Sporosarcina sp. JAI121]NYF23607.1 hypothetical protein [Sporosarcina sp. JAI121]
MIGPAHYIVASPCFMVGHAVDMAATPRVTVGRLCFLVGQTRYMVG